MGESLEKGFSKTLREISVSDARRTKKLKNQDDKCYFELIIKDKVSIGLSRLKMEEREATTLIGDHQTDPIRVFKIKPQKNIAVSFLNNQTSLKDTIDKEGSQRTIEQFVEMIHICACLFSSKKDKHKRVYISLREESEYCGQDTRNKAYILCDRRYNNIELDEVGNNVTVIRNQLINKRQSYLNEKKNKKIKAKYIGKKDYSQKFPEYESKEDLKNKKYTFIIISISVFVIGSFIAYSLGFFSSSETDKEDKAQYIV